MSLRCPECHELARASRPGDETHGATRLGCYASVEPERLAHAHADGSGLCPVMTDRGYQPALPEDAGETAFDAGGRVS